MLELSKLKPVKKKKNRKRVGRGQGSGSGTYAGRGMKGQKSRSGGNVRPGFEGGRMPLIKQIPKKRGFKSLQPRSQVVRLAEIEKSFKAGEVVSPKGLKKLGVIDKINLPVKILGGGALTKKLHIKNVLVSKTAKAAIEKAGGIVEIVQEKEKK